MDKSKSELYTATLDKEGKIVWVKKKNSMGAFDYFNYAFFILFGVICLFPVVYEVLLSFASRADYLHFKIIVFPAHFNLEAYKSIFFQGQVGRSFLISVGLTVGGTLYSMILTSLGAYIFTRKQVPGMKILFTFVIFTMFFGGGLIPFYFVCKDIFGTDNLWVLVLPFGINTFNMIVLRNFFSQVPESIIESCRLDGASEFTILLLFVIPLSKAGLATVILFYVVGKWDDWYWPMIFLTKNTHLSPLALELRNVLTMGVDRPIEDGEIDWTQIFSEGRNAAMICISLLPLLCIYPFLQKYFTKGVMIGGVKA